MKGCKSDPKVRELVARTGVNQFMCSKALKDVGGSVNQAYELLRMTTLGVVRKNRDGSNMTRSSMIAYVKEHYPEEGDGKGPVMDLPFYQGG